MRYQKNNNKKSVYGYRNKAFDGSAASCDESDTLRQRKIR